MNKSNNTNMIQHKISDVLDKDFFLFGFVKSIIDTTNDANKKVINQPKVAKLRELICNKLKMLVNKPPEKMLIAAGKIDKAKNIIDNLLNPENLRFEAVSLL